MCDPGLKRLVQLPRAHPQVELAPHLLGRVQERMHAVAVQRGDGNDGRESDHGNWKRTISLHLFAQARGVLQQIPLAQHDDDPSALLDGLGGDLLVLVHDPLGGIDHEKDQVGVCDALDGPVHGIYSMGSFTLLLRRIPAVSRMRNAAAVCEGTLDHVAGRPGIAETGKCRTL